MQTSGDAKVEEMVLSPRADHAEAAEALTIHPLPHVAGGCHRAPKAFLPQRLLQAQVRASGVCMISLEMPDPAPGCMALLVHV